MQSDGSLISKNAEIGNGVVLGHCVHVCDNVEIGDNCSIGDYCVIGHPSSVPRWKGSRVCVGRDAIIRSHCVLYEGSVFGPRLETGHYVVIREGTRTGENLRVGNHSDIEGDCRIGDYCRFHGYVHVGKGSAIGNFVWLFSLVTITNDPLPPSDVREPVLIEDGVVVAIGVTPLAGTRLGKGCFVAAGNVVKGDVPPAAVVVNGKVVFPVTRLVNIKHGMAHPWMNHFKHAYPSDAWPRIEQLRDEICEHAKKIVQRR